MTVTLHHGDAVQWARDYEGELFHACFCDAPYEMQFMNKGWDGSGVAFDPETWRAFARVLHPGAFLFVFAGKINDDLISVAMREAGLRKYHKMQGWVYGSGFPKASRIDTQIDRRPNFAKTNEFRAALDELRKQKKYSIKQVNEHFGMATTGSGMASHWFNHPTQPTIPTPEQYAELKNWWGFNGNLDEIYAKAEREVIGVQKNAMQGWSMDGSTKFVDRNITAPATPLAQTWAGHRYGLQALKPALETVLIFQKPYAGRPVDSITQTGAGALWIDGARIPHSEEIPLFSKDNKRPGTSFDVGSKRTGETTTLGRWGSNFYLVGDEAARRLDEQSGVLKSGARKGANHINSMENSFSIGNGWQYTGGPSEASEGGASRFFLRVSEQIDAADPVRYCAKASRRERDAGLEGLPPAKLDFDRATSQFSKGIAEREGRGETKLNPRHNPHPTVKPLALTRYLATLLLPPAEYAPRRVFVPFAGVASEVIGCLQAGWEHVEGVELTEEYIPIAEARVKYWEERKREEMEQAQMVMEL